MEQHPIPQQITSYQFRLVGDMTLKQFFELAGGAVASLVIYSTPLHPLLKWPLVFFFALFGVALAFLPFEDRPLEDWVIAFFRSIYSPTIYTWKKLAAGPKFYRDEPFDSAQGKAGPEDIKLEKYLAQAEAQKPAFAKKLEAYEETFLKGVGSLFGAVQSPTPAPVAPVPATADQINVPGAPRISVVATNQTVPPTPASNIPRETAADVAAPLATKDFSGTKQAEFSPVAAPPAPPSFPNTFVGQVLDSQGKIVESAILEVKDASGRPVRALRTNKLGHFMVVTPLVNGLYEIVTDKEGFEFEPFSLEAKGELIQPIVIRAKTNAN